jgi:hypothetical protein
MIDSLAFEPQFVDHVAPVVRLGGGRLLVDRTLVERARAQGLEAESVDVGALRRLPQQSSDPGDGPPAFTVSIGDIKAGRRLGYRRFVFMEHGIGQAYLGERGFNQRHPSYAGGLDRDDVEVFLCPNEYSARLWRDAYPSSRVEVIGSPRLDDLPARIPSGPTTIAVSFHWPAHVSPEADSTLGTYWASLGELARHFTLIGHAHPKGDWPKRMKRIYDRAGIEFVSDFAEVCRRADVYVCDNSSTLYEFASTGRPVVVLNGKQYRKRVSHGLRFWDAADVGIQVDEPAQLVRSIERALIDEPEVRERREAALSIVYAYRSGAAARAVDAIESWSREIVHAA